MIKTLLLFLVSAIALSGCTQKNSFKITGTFNGEEHKYIYAYRVDINNTERIDSAKINKKGIFHFTIRSKETDYYQIGFSTSEFITLLANPGENIKLQFEGKNLFSNYKVTGSAGSQQIKMLDSALLITNTKIDSLRVEYDASVSSADFSVKGPQLDKAFSDLLVNQRKFNIAFILDNTNSLASVKALYQKINDGVYVLYEPRDLQFFKIVNDSLRLHYPDSRHTIALNEYFQIEMNKFNMDQITRQAMNKPSLKLDPTLTDINGRKIALSSLKGKYVLLSFWSALCQDCIAENLELKKIYNSFSGKGFEIYQVNIDANETAWRDAVRFDELPWINVREDSTSIISNYILYNVKTLPANFFYNINGEIIGKDLNSTQLKTKLEQLLR
jgi:thiol-disulfide isomerase/thioredoxin